MWSSVDFQFYENAISSRARLKGPANNDIDETDVLYVNTSGGTYNDYIKSNAVPGYYSNFFNGFAFAARPGVRFCLAPPSWGCSFVPSSLLGACPFSASWGGNVGM